jgi:DNA repair exonuclease SbcCD ATPase subunit
MPTSKPTNIDAHRILAIMDELKEKLTYLSVATPQVLGGLQSEEGAQTCELLGPELMKQFAEQTRLEELYMVANSQAENAFGTGEENDDMREDVKALQKNTLDLCRKMRVVPNIVQELRNFQERDATRNVILFLKTLADMQELTLKRLTTTVEEERSRQELLEHYKSREAEASKRRQQLEKDLNIVRREGERAQSQRNEILTKLKADLLDVKVHKADRMTSLRSRFEARMKAHQEAFDARKDALEKKINALKDANKKTKDQNNEEENALKSKAKRYTQDVGALINEYDETIKDRAQQHNEKTIAYTNEIKQLNELTDHFKKVDQEKATIEAEEALVDVRRKKRDDDKKRKDAASALVQAFWRGIIQREGYAQMKKSKKKGGGGKKKK